MFLCLWLDVICPILYKEGALIFLSFAAGHSKTQHLLGRLHGKKFIMIHPRLEVLPEWINYLDTFNNRENIISASTRYVIGYKDRNPIVYNDPWDGIIVAIKWSSLAFMINGMPTSWIWQNLRRKMTVSNSYPWSLISSPNTCGSTFKG